MNKRGKTIEYVVFCMNNRIEHVPLESEPEAFAGFVDDNLVVYIPQETQKQIPDAIMEVLNGYPDVRLLTEIRL